MRTKALLLQFRALFPDICEVLCFWAIAGGCPDKHFGHKRWASKFAPIFGRGSKGEKVTFGAAWTLKTELPPARELNFHKIAEFRKIRKSKKNGPKNDPRGGTKIDFVTPFASELVVWRRQLAQIRALADPRCKKRAKQAPRTPKN